MCYNIPVTQGYFYYGVFMDIIFYNISSTKDVVTKTLSNRIDSNFVFKSNAKITNISIIVKNNISNFSSNYCFIPKLKRYYYIDNCIILNNDSILLELSIDVLMTYSNPIKSGYYHIIEEDIVNDNYTNITTSDKTHKTTIQYELPFVEPCNILITQNRGVK